MVKLTEEQIRKYAKHWNVRVNARVATEILTNLDTEKVPYIDMLKLIHELGVSIETTIALEYIIHKLYNPEPGNKGTCGPMYIQHSAVDTIKLKSQGHYFGNEVV